VGDPDPIGIRELRQHASRYVDMAESGRRVPADPDLISSALLAVEARRGMLRNRPDGLPMVDLVLHDVTLLSVSDAVIESAGRLPDPLLPSLDAIHLATALLIREDVEAVLIYDDRLAAAAAAHELSVVMPA
jgi:hypothetical protein